MNSLSTEFYKTQLQNQQKHKKILIVKIVLFVIVMFGLVFTIREEYNLLIQTFGILGWKSAFVHEYPILSGLFFCNKNTASTIVNFFYGYLNKEISFQRSLTCNYESQLDYIVDLSNIVNSSPTCTVYGYMENNCNMGYEDCIAFLTKEGVLPTSTPSFFKTTLNALITYGIPIVMLGGMLLG